MLNIKSQSISLTSAIKDSVAVKAARLHKFYPVIKIIEVELELTTRHHHKGRIFRATGNVDVPGKLLRAEVTQDDLYLAVNELFRKLKSELIKYKEKKSV